MASALAGCRDRSKGGLALRDFLHDLQLSAAGGVYELDGHNAIFRRRRTVKPERLPRYAAASGHSD